MTCPAKARFGPRMIAVLASVHFQALHNIYELRSDDPAERESLGDLRRPLDSQRDSYRHLVLYNLEADGCG